MRPPICDCAGQLKVSGVRATSSGSATGATVSVPLSSTAFSSSRCAVSSLAARVYGVRYPEHALRALAVAGVSYGGWLPNHRVPEVYARFAVTVHVPRRPYVRALPGIPTIRVFEALACGIPLVSAPWDDVEGLFGPDDMLFAPDAEQMVRYLCSVLADRDLAQTLAQNGLATIRARHTCGHRVDQLLGICAELGAASARLPEVA